MQDCVLCVKFEVQNLWSVSYLHEVLIPGLSELDEVRLNAVHPLVNLSVVCRLLLQIFFETPFTVHNFTDAGF